MLRELSAEQARFVAILARTARVQRDSLLGNVAENELGAILPGRGGHNPTAALGFEPLPPDASQMIALRDAISSLSEAARWELYALMRIGQGHLATKKWHRGLTEAQMLTTEAVIAALLEDADLHGHLMKGLYEADLAA